MAPLQNICSRFLLLGQALRNSPHGIQQLRCAGGFAQNVMKQEKRKSEVHQFVGDNAVNTRIVYAWGLAEAGALGIRDYVRPDLKSMRNKSDKGEFSGSV